MEIHVWKTLTVTHKGFILSGYLPSFIALR